MTRIKLRYIHEYRDRKGNVWRYFRRRGWPSVRLPGLPGSPEFMQAYKDALAGSPSPIRPFKSGTLGALVASYYTSANFANLKPSSRATYRFVLGKHVEADGHRLVADMPVRAAMKIIAEIGATRPGMANLTRSILLAVFDYAVSIELRRDNPFKPVPTYKMKERHTWTDAEIGAYEARWPLGTRERLAFAVLLYSAQRIGDAVKLKRSDVLTITQEKTGAELTIPVHPALARAVRAGPAKGIYLIGDERGKPIIGDTLSRLIRKAASKAGLGPQCKAHGIRKAALRRLAEHQATTKEIAAVSGHKTLREIERYTAKADQGKMARSAIARLPDEQ